MTKDDGGPVFPQEKIELLNINASPGGKQTVEPITERQGGMSLHDWFAGAALQGAMFALSYTEGEARQKYAEQIPTLCYAMADAMIAEKRKREKK